MSNISWEAEPYEDKDGNWIPKAVVSVQDKGKTQVIPLELPLLPYEEKEDAVMHSEYLAKDYIAKNFE